MNKKNKFTILMISLVLLISYIFFPLFTETLITKISYPITIVAKEIKNGSKFLFTTIFKDKVELVEENEFFKIANERLSNEIKNINMNKENESFVRATILLRPPQTKYGKLVVNYKNNENLKVGAVVYEKNLKIPIGVLSSSSNSIGNVELFSSPFAEYNFVINNYLSKSKGVGSGGFVVEVPSIVDVDLGDSIYFSNNGKLTLAGEVQKVEPQSSKALRNIYAVMGINIYSIYEVLISKDEILYKEDNINEDE